MNMEDTLYLIEKIKQDKEIQMTQERTVLNILQEGRSITAYEAVKIGIYRLADVIYKIRQKGYNIKSTVAARNKKNFVSYSLVDDKIRYLPF